MSSFLHLFQAIVFCVRRKTEEPEGFFMSKENKCLEIFAEISQNTEFVFECWEKCKDDR